MIVKRWMKGYNDTSNPRNRYCNRWPNFVVWMVLLPALMIAVPLLYVICIVTSILKLVHNAETDEAGELSWFVSNVFIHCYVKTMYLSLN
jgi:hypothetical protein